MSIEYEVRSDDSYSHTASAAEAREILRVQWGVEGARAGVLVYEADRCRVEIELGSEGGTPEDGRIQWVGLRVPAGARLESAARAVEIGMSLGRGLGWRLFDPQSDAYVEPSDLEPGPEWREAVAQLIGEVRGERAKALGKRLWLALRLSSRAATRACRGHHGKRHRGHCRWRHSAGRARRRARCGQGACRLETGSSERPGAEDAGRLGDRRGKLLEMALPGCLWR